MLGCMHAYTTDNSDDRDGEMMPVRCDVVLCFTTYIRYMLKQLHHFSDPQVIKSKETNEK